MLYQEAKASRNFLQDVSDIIKNSPPSALQKKWLEDMFEEISDKTKYLRQFRDFVKIHSNSPILEPVHFQRLPGLHIVPRYTQSRLGLS